jgi:hypothetical protein
MMWIWFPSMMKKMATRPQTMHTMWTRLPSVAKMEKKRNPSTRIIGHTGVDNNSIQNTGVEDGNLPEIAGVAHNKVTGVTKQVDSEPEMEDDHPIEEERMD